MKIFNLVNANKPKRNVFDLSHERKLSMNFGDLVPVFCQETIPGDTFRLNTEYLVRFAPMLAPVMHKVDVYTHYFFVPNRIIFNQWKEFITGGEDGQDNTVFPFIQLNQETPQYFDSGKLPDYFDIPVQNGYNGEIVNINVLPFRAYAEIWNEYYRDQNLQEKIKFSKDGGNSQADIEALTTIRKRNLEKDYFTSALPWAQKGGAVQIPLTGNAEVVLKEDAIVANIIKNATEGHPIYGQSSLQTDDNGTLLSDGVEPAVFDPNGTLEADMSNVTASTVNELREAFQLQKWLERNARSGSRYIESILAHFGVKSSDARLQRPEYLGGGKTPVIISEVLQTSSSDEVTPQGNMAGHGVSLGNTHSFKAFFEEHGFVIGLMSVLPKTGYSQGIPRIFNKFDKFDYYWPEFAHLGEQAVLNQEIYLSPTADPKIGKGNKDTFGYQSRYAEYKYIPNYVNGDFRTTLTFWHLNRDFQNQPALNADFITCDEDKNGYRRIFAYEGDNEHHIWVQMHHNFQAIRPMPVFSDPGYIDH